MASVHLARAVTVRVVQAAAVKQPPPPVHQMVPVGQMVGSAGDKGQVVLSATQIPFVQAYGREVGQLTSASSQMPGTVTEVVLTADAAPYRHDPSRQRYRPAGHCMDKSVVLVEKH